MLNQVVIIRDYHVSVTRRSRFKITVDSTAEFRKKVKQLQEIDAVTRELQKRGLRMSDESTEIDEIMQGSICD